MAQTSLSHFFKRKGIEQVKRKQTSIDVFCVKNTRPSFDMADDEVMLCYVYFILIWLDSSSTIK